MGIVFPKYIHFGMTDAETLLCIWEKIVFSSSNIP